MSQQLQCDYNFRLRLPWRFLQPRSGIGDWNSREMIVSDEGRNSNDLDLMHGNRCHSSSSVIIISVYVFRGDCYNLDQELEIAIVAK